MKFKGYQPTIEGARLELWDITEGPATGTTVALPEGSTEPQRARKFVETTILFRDQ